MMACSSRAVSKPTFRSIVACAIDPAISCRQSRQSNEMDSLNLATLGAGPPEKRPLRDTGLDFDSIFKRCKLCAKNTKSHATKSKEQIPVAPAFWCVFTYATASSMPSRIFWPATEPASTCLQQLEHLPIEFVTAKVFVLNVGALTVEDAKAAAQIP